MDNSEKLKRLMLGDQHNAKAAQHFDECAFIIQTSIIEQVATIFNAADREEWQPMAVASCSTMQGEVVTLADADGQAIATYRAVLEADTNILDTTRLS